MIEATIASEEDADGDAATRRGRLLLRLQVCSSLLRSRPEDVDATLVSAAVVVVVVVPKRQ